MSRSDGLERLGRLTELPCVPYDFANSVASDSLVQVIRTMVDADRHGTLTFLAKLVKASLGETEEFWNGVKQESQLLSLLNFTGEYNEGIHYGSEAKLISMMIQRSQPTQLIRRSESWSPFTFELLYSPTSTRLQVILTRARQRDYC